MSKKAGRPLKSPELRDNILSFRLNSTELKCLEAWVHRYDTSVGDVVRDSLSLLSVIPDNPIRKY